MTINVSFESDRFHAPDTRKNGFQGIFEETKAVRSHAGIAWDGSAEGVATVGRRQRKHRPLRRVRDGKLGGDRSTSLPGKRVPGFPLALTTRGS